MGKTSTYWVSRRVLSIHDFNQALEHGQTEEYRDAAQESAEEGFEDGFALVEITGIKVRNYLFPPAVEDGKEGVKELKSQMAKQKFASDETAYIVEPDGLDDATTTGGEESPFVVDDDVEIASRAAAALLKRREEEGEAAG